MTRIAIVADGDDLRGALANALRADEAFDVVAVIASEDEVPDNAEAVLVVRERVLRDGNDTTVLNSALTNREREILALLADGMGNKQIAARLGISTNTVKTHLELLFERLGVSSRAEAVAVGVRRGLLLL